MNEFKSELEEITLNAELNTPPSWKQWINENKIYLAGITLLSFLSLSLMIINQTEAPPAPIPPIKTILPPRLLPIKKMAPRKKPRSPFQRAQTLFKTHQEDKAISVLIQLSSAHKSETIRMQASKLAKKFHGIQQERTRIKKHYLQGYILYATYPKKACAQWQKAIQTQLINNAYFKKANKRLQLECLIK